MLRRLFRKDPKPETFTVVSEGASTCRHAMVLVPWELAYGDDVAPCGDGYYAIYRDLYRCQCGRTIVREAKAFI